MSRSKSYIFLFSGIVFIAISWLLQSFNPIVCQFENHSFYRFEPNQTTSFLANKTLRFLLNSLGGIAIIHSIIQDFRFTRLMIRIQGSIGIGLFFIYITAAIFETQFGSGYLAQKLQPIALHPFLIVLSGIWRYFQTRSFS